MVVLVLAISITAGLLEEGWSGPHYKFVPLALLWPASSRCGPGVSPVWPKPSPRTTRETRFSSAWPGHPAGGDPFAVPGTGSHFRSVFGYRVRRRQRRVAAPEALHPNPCSFVPGHSPPHSVVSQLSLGFQSLVTRGAATVLDRVAVPNLRSGIILELSDRQCLVDEAASGADRVLLVLVITMFYAFSASVRPCRSSYCWRRPSSGLWRPELPALPVSLTWRPSRERAFREDGRPPALGLVAVAATLALVLSTDRFLWLREPSRGWLSFLDSSTNPASSRGDRPIPMTAHSRRRLVSWQFTAAFGLLAMFQVPLFYAEHPS